MSSDEAPLTITQAEELLSGLPLIPAMAGSIADMKALRLSQLASMVGGRLQGEDAMVDAVAHCMRKGEPT